MHLLLAGSMIATLSAWAVTPSTDIFNSGLAEHFASAIEQANQDCPASAPIANGDSMLVMLDGRGDSTEVILGSMPAIAARELRTAIPAVFAGAQPSVIREALINAAMGAAADSEEIDVEVSVTNGVGQIVVEHNGDRKIIEIDLSDLGSIDLDAIAEEVGDSGIDMHTLLSQMMGGATSSAIQAEGVIEFTDDDGEHHQNRIRLGDHHDGNDNERMMLFMGDEEGYWMPGPNDGHNGMGRNHGDAGAEMLRQHMHFLAEMQDDPNRAWRIIESLPPEMRREHEEFFHQLMGHNDEHDDNGFFEQVDLFDEKLSAAGNVVNRLADKPAIAVFGVWQARELLDPEARVHLLAPMMNDNELIIAVRNAASFVVMEALGEMGDTAGATESLRSMIRRNGAK